MDEPLVAVIFTSLRTDLDGDGYARASARMAELAAARPGFRGVESARGADGVGITVSYWASADDAAAWKHDAEHLAIQQVGRDRWYEWYRVKVATVDREYTYDQGHVSSHEGTGT